MTYHIERTNKKDYGLIEDGKDHYVIEVAFTQTPKPKRQIEILQSPLFFETQKDLFSQLLGSDMKDRGTPMMLLGFSNKKSDCLGSAFKDDEFEFEQKMDEEMSDQFEDDNDDLYPLQTKEDLLRKRRRKSTGQLKVLKQQFDKRQGQWSKQKIVKMAELTGLSESQVYKWCWDQKKKHQPCSKGSRILDTLQSQNEDNQQKSSSNFPRTKFIQKQMRTKRKEYGVSLRNETLRKRE